MIIASSSWPEEAPLPKRIICNEGTAHRVPRERTWMGGGGGHAKNAFDPYRILLESPFQSRCRTLSVRHVQHGLINSARMRLALSRLRASACVVGALFKWRWELDSGYRDLQLAVSINDMVCELQLNTHVMAFAKAAAAVRKFFRQ